MAAACALAIFSGKIIYKFGIPERLRTLRYSIFTGKDIKVSNIFLQFMELAQAFSFWRLTASPGIRIL
ncbi:MAG: hypothetical protein EGR21_01585 [Faecalibacterium prausnitzii]|nr:hypothetical protein [Faecalibacterium prausnitzii]